MRTPADDLRTALRARWPLAGLPDVRDELLAAYGDPARGYHDLRHLGDVLAWVDRLAVRERVDREAVALAAWFHDAVYDGRPDDEERSAAWARSALATYPRVDEVVRLVLLTADHRPPDGDADGAVLCDADLAVLGTHSPQRYAAYVAGVRAEYAQHPLADFCAGRARILRALLGGPLFHTATGLAWWQGRAQLNLTAELRVLDDLAAR